MDKGMKRRWILFFVAVMVCSMLFGSMVSVGAAGYETEAFFTAEGGTLTVTEDYDSGVTEGVKLAVTDAGSNGTATIKYNDVISASALGSAAVFQVLPAAAEQADFGAVQILLRDSEDASKVLSVLIQVGEFSGSRNTVGFAFLEEDFTRNNYGAAWYKTAQADKQRIYGKDWWIGSGSDTDRYCEDGTLNLGTWNTHYPLLAAEETTDTDVKTSLITVSYQEAVASVNGIVLAELKNDFYQSLNQQNLDPSEDASVIAKLNDAYVDGLFSSGKVSAELRFFDIYNGSFALNLVQLGERVFAKSYENNFESTEEINWDTQETQQVTGTKFTITDAPLELGTIPVSALGNAVTFQLLPNGTGDDLAAENVLITLRDSADRTKSVTVIIEKATLWWGTMHTAGFVSLEENTVRVGEGWRELSANSKQKAVAYDGWQGKGYSDYGTIYLGAGWGTYYPFLGAAEGRYTKTMTVSYTGSQIKMNDTLLADLKDDTFQLKSTEYLDPTANADIIAKYTDEYVDNLFSSGEVIVELRFEGAINGSVNVISLGGEPAANMQFGALGGKDTLAPTITSVTGAAYDAEEKSFTVKRGEAYAVNALATVAATDNMDAAPVTGVEVYSAAGVKYETETVTFADGDYVILYAVDADGNRAELRAAIEFLPTYSVTYTDNSGENAVVSEGDAYVFGTAEKEDLVFAGWVLEGKLYPAGYEITVTGNVEVSALFLDFATANAEKVGENTIRYFTWIAEEDYAELEALAENLQFGTVITCDTKAGHLDIQTKVWASESSVAGSKEYRAAFNDIPGSMYDAAFTATGYVIVTYANNAAEIVLANGYTVSVNQAA